MIVQRRIEQHQKLCEVIDSLLVDIAEADCDSEQYRKLVDQLVKLYRIKETDASIELKKIESLTKQEHLAQELDLKEKELEQDGLLRLGELGVRQKELDLRRRVSADTWATVAANIAGIMVIVGYERVNVVASKALGFVLKLR